MAELGTEQYRRRLWAATLCLALIPTFLFLQDWRRVTQEHFGDFHHFYYGAKALRDGTDPYDTDDPYATGRSGYIYPPLVAFLYTPLASLDIVPAARISLLINTALLVATLLLVADEYVRRLRGPANALTIIVVALIVEVALADKIKGELQMFQTNVLMLLMFALGLRWMERRPIASGTALGVVMNIKYLSILMLPYFLLRRNWRAAGALVVSSIGWALLPAVLSGWSTNLRNLAVAFKGVAALLGLASEDAERANIDPLSAPYSISITSALARFTRAWHSSMLTYLLVAIVLCATLAVLWIIYRRRGVNIVRGRCGPRALVGGCFAMGGLEWATILVLAIIFSPQTNTRHLLLLAPATAALATLLVLPDKQVSKRAILAALLLMVFGITMPPGLHEVSWIHNLSRPWFYSGATSWFILSMLLILMWQGTGRAVRLGDEPSSVDVDAPIGMSRALPAAEARSSPTSAQHTDQA